MRRVFSRGEEEMFGFSREGVGMREHLVDVPGVDRALVKSSHHRFCLRSQDLATAFFI